MRYGTIAHVGHTDIACRAGVRTGGTGFIADNDDQRHRYQEGRQSTGSHGIRPFIDFDKHPPPGRDLSSGLSGFNVR